MEDQGQDQIKDQNKDQDQDQNKDQSQNLYQDQDQDQDYVEFLRRKIKYYFMNPCEKFHARGRKPWKLFLQIVKIALITIQLVLFGLNNQMVVTFTEENLLTFKHLFLLDYVDGSADTYAVYRQEDVHRHVQHALQQFGLIHNTTVGNHEYGQSSGGGPAPLALCQDFYRKGTIFPGNDSFHIDTHVDTECVQMFPSDDPPLPYLHLDFTRLLTIRISFVLKAINLQTVRHRELPDCYDFSISIVFNNKAHSGRMKVDLETDVDINECRDWSVSGASAKNVLVTVLFDCLILVLCVASFTLCTRSVINGIHLQQEYLSYCRTHCGREVSWSDRLEFLSGWYILIILSDTLTIIGSILKMEIQTKVLTNYDVCSIFLGTGTMFVWIGAIRYMGYFKKYNILILTLRAAFPNVIRFICCAGIIYLGYCFCGWIVLGPYHQKFRTLATVSETLFSLINGDDMYATFSSLGQQRGLVWMFSRIYLYSFVCLFIYMVLSLFITIITDTYDTIKQQQQNGSSASSSDLQRFLSACQDRPDSGAYRLDQNRGCFPDCLTDCLTDRCRRRQERLRSED